jgi:hypothetical protein
MRTSQFIHNDEEVMDYNLLQNHETGMFDVEMIIKREGKGVTKINI